MYESQMNLKRFEMPERIGEDGFPEPISLLDMDDFIETRFGSHERYLALYGEALTEELRRAIENHYSNQASENTPVYVFETIDCYHAINAGFRGERMPKPSFTLDDGVLFDYLVEHPERLAINRGWMPIGYEPSPVILVYDELNGSRASEFLNILKRNKITFHAQDVDEVRDLIYSTTPDEVEREIRNQCSRWYEPKTQYERTFALWLI